MNNYEFHGFKELRKEELQQIEGGSLLHLAIFIACVVVFLLNNIS